MGEPGGGVTVSKNFIYWSVSVNTDQKRAKIPQLLKKLVAFN